MRSCGVRFTSQAYAALPVGVETLLARSALAFPVPPVVEDEDARPQFFLEERDVLGAVREVARVAVRPQKNRAVRLFGCDVPAVQAHVVCGAEGDVLVSDAVGLGRHLDFPVGVIEQKVLKEAENPHHYQRACAEENVAMEFLRKLQRPILIEGFGRVPGERS